VKNGTAKAVTMKHREEWMRHVDLAAALTLSLLSLTAAGCSSNADGAADAAQSAEPACDRDCLIGVTDDYLAALAAHDPAAAPLAANVAFVENTARLKPGEGLWKTATGGKTDFSIYVPDTDLQQAGWMGVMERDGKPVMLALRLKIVDGKITQAEHLVTEPAQGRMENLQAVRSGLRSEIPENRRLSHDELIRIGASYYDALDDNDGSKMPFADDCSRHENGMITAGKDVGPPPGSQPGQPRTATDCKGQLDSQAFVYIDRIENRRMIAADPVTGLVMGLSHFRHPMDNLPYKVTNSDGSVTERNAENMPYEPFDMPAAHIFKISPDGKVHEIEAVGVRLPYNSKTGWE
jgi:hypothetical protein